jgi:hypothetical protein
VSGEREGSTWSGTLPPGREALIEDKTHLLDGLDSRLEGGGVDLLESGSSDVGLEVGSLVERVDLDGGLGDRGESPLGPLAGGPQSSESSGVVGDVKLVLSLELG